MSADRVPRRAARARRPRGAARVVLVVATVALAGAALAEASEGLSLRTLTAASLLGLVVFGRSLHQGRRLEREAGAARDRLAEHLEGMPGGFFTLDRSLCVTYVNGVGKAFMDLPDDEILGRAFWETFPKLVASPFEAAVRRAADEDLAVDVEAHVAGTDRWFELRAQPIAHGVSVYFREVTTRKRAEQQIEHLAYHDRLTGLPNVALLDQHLTGAMARARRASRAVALLLIDLDGFKLVNDSLGHGAGDELLRAVAARLDAITRAGDILARQGGDEFLLMLADLERDDARASATALADRVGEELQAPFAVSGTDIVLGASVGISLFPEHAEDAVELVQRADAAMYRAKHAGGGWALHQAEARPGPDRLALAGELRRALDHGEFRLDFQPIFLLGSGACAGVEALVRWHHGARGVVPPGDFIDVAERIGFIDELGEWVLGALCEQARAWHDAGLEPHLGINVAPRQLHRADFAGAFSRTIAAHGLDPRRFIVELTESAWTVEASQTLPVLHEMRAAGLTLAIDDFGAGYSSLSRLRQLPVDVVKVDRAFMAGLPDDPEAAAIVTAILSLAEATGCDVVAEGIETEAQRRFLADRGCRFAQGFHLGRPLDAAAITALLHERLLPARIR